MIGIIIGILGFIVAAFMAVMKGMSMQKTKQVKKEHKSYVKTRNEIDDSQRDADKSGASSWLRKRIDRRDL